MESVQQEVVTFQGRDFRTGQPTQISVKDGVIVKISSNIEGAFDENLWIGPGLVDLQVNGYQGHDLNTSPLKVESVRHVTKSLWQEGVTSYMPTVITNSDERIEQALKVIAHFIETDEWGRNIAGIHLEGPFISPEDGPRGAHPLAFVKPPDWELFEKWQHVAKGHIRMITLSPEWPSAPNFIKRCVAKGVKVAIGHTAANTEQIKQAVEAGASFSTHLGNGAHAVLPRHPHYIWDQLAADELWAGIIGDGFHLPVSLLKVIYKVKQSKTILVSDAVDLAGLSPGNYVTHVGGHVVLTPEGRLHLADQPQLLAGSVKSIREGMETFLKGNICEFQKVWEMASINPSTMLELPTAKGLTAGAPADLVMFKMDQTGRLNVIQTIKRGKIVYNLM
ncbi:N-acetylglucosamine-6-phosphate deacetylase [Pullulanibacillus pueri]|uniref:N-acetylglucosamine-6-phosphate deacetylase n=1 Tax=Pullulanibacillus pueri TaxID=1437324 RepID=A0A8J2ZZM2_9BACL|nr:amidohydrolase family protein [Pullulanibacillus pueri]MBM7683332.1 N-acetylglucosamine-6-phosphate deacetylase [Pullulanibacillus pueri]GGH86370.1 N-acetylglucosamine-6-phosphate deacetylase [Pullulanibacillus pueri]